MGSNFIYLTRSRWAHGSVGNTARWWITLSASYFYY